MYKNDTQFEDSFGNKIVKGVCCVAILAVVVFGVKFALYTMNEDEAFGKAPFGSTPRSRAAANKSGFVQAPTARQKANTAWVKATKVGAKPSMEDWERLVKLYTALFEKNSKIGLFAFRKGYSLHAAKKIDEAIEAHKVAATLATTKRGKATAIYNLACAYALKKDKQKCMEALDEAISAGFISTQKRGPISNDTDFAFVKDDPEFKRLEKLALPKTNAAAPTNIYRQFDFWIGSWDVYNKSGKKVGRNIISKSENGFLLTENWTNAKGKTGTSMNFVDPKDKKWKQVWVDQGGNVVRYSGEFKNGIMQLNGTTHKADGQTELGRVTFTLLSDGRVRQFIERSTDNGVTWKKYFEGFYKKDTSDTDE